MSTDIAPTKENEGWLALFEHYPLMVAKARSGGAGDDAEDIASSVLLSIVGHRDWPFEVSWPYVATAVRHELIDRHRRTVRDRDLIARLAPIEAAACCVEDEAILATEVERVMQAMTASQSGKTIAMVRARFGGMSWREVASVFEIPPPAVQARVRRAVIRMRRVLLVDEKLA